MDRRLSAPWRPAESVPVILLALGVTMVAGSMIGLVVEEGTAYVLALMVLPVALALTTALWIGLRHPGSFAAVGLPSARPGRDLGHGFVWGIGLFAFTTLVVAPMLFGVISLLAGEPVTPPMQEVLPPQPETLHIVLGGFAAIVAAPIGEELFFRGLLHTALRRRLGFWPAGGISSAAFAVLHIIPLLMPLFFVVGLGLAYVYERRGSLVAPIAAHIAFNVIGYLLIVRQLLQPSS